jgi:hypothetical protein
MYGYKDLYIHEYSKKFYLKSLKTGNNFNVHQQVNDKIVTHNGIFLSSKKNEL